MFRHQGDIIGEFINNEGSKVQHVFQVLVAITFCLKIKSLYMLEF